MNEQFSLNIVLVEPEIPQNTGNICRTCAATGAKLHLIEPLGFSIDDKQVRRAGLDYWHLLDVTVYSDLDDFFEKNSGEYYFFTTKGGNIHSDINYTHNCYLLFGKETAGLPEALLEQNRDKLARIPMLNDDAARSLNLSNAVAIGTYEVLRQWEFPTLRTAGKFE